MDSVMMIIKNGKTRNRNKNELKTFIKNYIIQLAGKQISFNLFKNKITYKLTNHICITI